MLLVVDVGNTNITFGVYDKKELVTTFRMMSKQPRTSDEYGISLRELLRLNHIEKKDIEGTIIASVVPGSDAFPDRCTCQIYRDNTCHCGTWCEDRNQDHL